MIEIIKNVLFNAFILIGLITVCLALLWYMLELLNRIFKFTKYIIMYKAYKRNVELYSLKDKVIVAKDGKALITCITDLDEQIKILEKAIQSRNDIKELREKYSK